MSVDMRFTNKCSLQNHSPVANKSFKSNPGSLRAVSGQSLGSLWAVSGQSLGSLRAHMHREEFIHFIALHKCMILGRVASLEVPRSVLTSWYPDIAYGDPA
jgi:hypothetical protein